MAYQNSFTINSDRQNNPHNTLDSNRQYHIFLPSVQELTAVQELIVQSIFFTGDDEDPIVPPN